MAVGFDAQLYYATPTGTSFSTNGLTIGSGANRALVVTTINSNPLITGIALTWNGAPLTLVSSTSVVDSTNSAYMSIFALLNPDAGNFALAGSWSGVSSNLVIGAVSYTGVDQTSVAVAFPHGNTASGSSSTATVSITSAVDNAVIASFASAPAGPFLSTSGTNIYIDSVTLTPYIAASRDVGAATVSMTAPLTTSGTWVANGCDILAAAAGLASQPLPSMFKRQMRSAQGPSQRVSGAWLGSPSLGTNGVLTVTEAADVVAFTGDLVIAAALAVTEAIDVAAFVGGPIIAAALAVTEAADTAAFNGSVIVSGTLTVTEAADVAAFAGSVSSATITGTLVVTEAADVAAFAGSVVVSGTLTTVEAKDILAFAGSVIVSGTLTTTEATDVAAFAGSVIVSGTLTVTEAKDVLAFAGSVTTALTGTFAAIETRDIASFNGGVGAAVTGTLTAKEAGISLSFNSFPENSAVNTLVGTLAVIGIDTAVFNGSVTGAVGTLAAIETQDTAFFQTSAVGAITGTLAVNESGILLSNNSFPENTATNTVVGSLSVTGVDAAAFSGMVGVAGTLAVTDAVDVVAFNGTVFTNITGTLTATEAKDSVSFAGTLFNPPAGQFVAFEAPDVAAFNGTVTGIVAWLATVETSDLAAFNGTITESLTTGILIVVEPADIAHFIGVNEPPDDSDFENWKFGHRFDRSLTSRFPWQSSFGSRP